MTVSLSGGLAVDDAALELLLDLERRGVRLEVSGRKLRAEPREWLSDSQTAALKTHQREVIALIRYTETICRKTTL